MRCPSCEFENAEGAKFCEECGTPFVRLCPSCGQQMGATAKFCPECGTALQVRGKPVPAKRRKSANPAGRVPRPATRPPTASPPVAALEAERRQLTVMFCDLVGSTALSTQLDPEELREVVRIYHETCTAVIRHYEGYIAQHLGDGLLVYFGYPAAHEDAAQRAVRVGLEIVEALQARGTGAQPGVPLHVRIGIHTGLVVIGEIGSSERREVLALGETPNLAARVQGQAAPNEVLVSPATLRLIHGLFDTEEREPQILKGIATPMTLYRVVQKGAAQSRFEVAVDKGLTPLVGRTEELTLLQRRWEDAKAGAGQVVLLSGEPGIGKSRLVQELKEQLMHTEVTRIEFRGSPYHQNSALYPIIDHLQHLLQFAREDVPVVKLEKLRRMLSHYRFPQTETVSLLAALLSLPHPAGAPPLTGSPQKQKQKTQEALVAWLREEAQRQAVYTTWEDLHWVDPSTLEVLTLFLDQVPTTRLLALLTFRPEFTPPWGYRSYLSQLTLSRLGRPQVEALVERMTGGKALPPEVVHQIVAKTDGVPLFVEELTKTVVESGLLIAVNNHYELNGPLPPLAIPSTLHDSLMARLDRLSTVKEIAQLGATIGREFSYELLAAVSLLDDVTLQQGLKQLVEVELVYQSGVMPQTRYLFKHALIQDTAYQSLLKSTRHQYHRQIAHVLEEQFLETQDNQPELLAHHYTAGGLITQAIPYWQKAGERASGSSANTEAIAHLTKGLELLQSLPDTPERNQQELTLQITLSTPLLYTKGYGSPELEQTYSRALDLCRQVGETPLLFPALLGLWVVYFHQREYHKARAQAEQLLHFAENAHDPALLMTGHTMMALTLFYLGELSVARAHFEQGLTQHDPQQPFPISVDCLSHLTDVLWELGYPDQALTRVHEALAVARQLSLPFYVGFALFFTAGLHYARREEQAAQEQAEEAITLSREQGFPFWLGWATILRGWALAEQEQGEEGIRQIHQGLDTLQAIRSEVGRPSALALLARAYERVGQVEAGLSVVAESLKEVDKTGERRIEAELYRLKGALTLQSQTSLRPVENKSRAGQRQAEDKSGISNTPPLTPSPHAEAEACFLKAIHLARRQQAKSRELRASTSLARLWQQQGKQAEAHQLLSEVYGWFTEGFTTKDLQEAKALLEELS